MPPACGACRKPVKWAVTVNNKYIPLNPDPDPDGNQAVFTDATGTLRTRQLRKGQEAAKFERVYMPHVATCTGPRPPSPPRRLAPVPLPPNVARITDAPSLRRGNPKSPPALRRGNPRNR